MNDARMAALKIQDSYHLIVGTTETPRREPAASGSAKVEASPGSAAAAGTDIFGFCSSAVLIRSSALPELDARRFGRDRNPDADRLVERQLAEHVRKERLHDPRLLLDEPFLDL